MKNNITIQQFNNYFAFILGREQKIALFELESVLRRFDVCFDILSLQDNIAIIKTEKASSFQLLAARLMENLGGTVKIYEISNNQKPITNKISNNQYEIIQSQIVGELLENKSNGTLNFGLSDYSGTFNERELKKLGIEIKKEARKVRPVRFVEGKGAELSSATSYHKIYKTGGEEFGIFDANSKFNLNSKLKIGNYQKDDNYLLGRLLATTNPDEWSDRDYGKPAGDKFSGMMPPKLARMMVNMALGQLISNNQETITSKINNNQYSITDKPKNRRTEKLKDIENLHNVVVLDPFCGSGNILMEAVLLGFEVIGSDISEKAVEDTRANLRWLISNNQYPITNEITNSKSGKINLINQDNEERRKNNGFESHNSSFIIHNSVFKADATSADFIKELKNRRTKEQKNIVVVTEPYLGKPKKFKDQKSKIKDEITELKSLYLSFFNNLKLLSTHYSLLAITFVLPIIETLDAGEISLYNECVDELRQMGYNTTRTLRYGRDYQVVKREIASLQLGNQRTEEQKNQFGNVL